MSAPEAPIWCFGCGMRTWQGSRCFNPCCGLEIHQYPAHKERNTTDYGRVPDSHSDTNGRG